MITVGGDVFGITTAERTLLATRVSGEGHETMTKQSTQQVKWLIAVALMALLAAACSTEADPQLEVVATIDDVALAEAGPLNPVRISDDESVLEMTVTNRGDEPQDVRYLRLEGDVLGLTFLTYTTRVQFELAPEEQRTVIVPLDFFDVESQAHGYLRAQLALYGADDTRNVVGAQAFAVDVRGSATSTMALFAVLLTVVTALSVAVNLVALSRRTLPANRFRRGLQFAFSGLGIGLVLAIAFSVLRVFPLPGSAWLPLVAIPTVIGFALGYAAPGPDDVTDADELDELRDLDELLADVNE